LIARRIARAVVQTGAAKECTVTLGIFPGEEAFSILSMIDGNGTSLEAGRWAGLFDLSLAGIGDRFTGCADLIDAARHGHFTNPALPWECIRFDDIRA
jgi:hypothetical protein